MPNLQGTDLFLLSSIMQTIGAIWGILFVVYVFVSDYFLREHGAASNAQSLTDRLNDPLARNSLNVGETRFGHNSQVIHQVPVLECSCMTTP